MNDQSVLEAHLSTRLPHFLDRILTVDSDEAEVEVAVAEITITASDSRRLVQIILLLRLNWVARSAEA